MAKPVVPQTKPNRDVHIVVAPKGGVGKSYVSALLAEFAQSRGEKMRVFDLDQKNTTLTRFKALDCEAVPLLSDDDRFDFEKMDAFIGKLFSENGPFLLDVGASVFGDVWRYFVRYQIGVGMREEGHRLIFHSVLAGGTETVDSLGGFKTVCAEAIGRQVVAWVNPVRGPVSLEGIDFLDMRVYRENEEKVLATIILPRNDEATLNDLSNLGKKRMILEEAKGDASIFFPSKQRLRVYRSEVFKQIELAWPLVMGADTVESSHVHV